jgi:hypothetical protein
MEALMAVTAEEPWLLAQLTIDKKRVIDCNSHDFPGMTRDECICAGFLLMKALLKNMNVDVKDCGPHILEQVEVMIEVSDCSAVFRRAERLN